MHQNKAPYSIELKGREQVIDAVKIGVTGSPIGQIYHILTEDNKIASVMESDILIHWNNQPTKECLENLDRLIADGENLLLANREKSNNQVFPEIG